MNDTARALVLDFGGVVTRTIFETQSDNERALGLAPGTLSWRGPFQPSSDPLWRAMQAGEISERDYYYTRAQEIGRLVGEDWIGLPQFLQRIRGADPQTAIRPEAIAAIAAVRNAGVKLAILSNELDLFYGPNFRGKLPFLADIDLIVDATYTGILKPDPRAYAFVTDGLALAARDCVFVDDQIKNVRGAQSEGFRTIHFDVTRPAEGYRAALRHFGL
jgi:putative hydrolase of the HAD superfamily